MHVQPARSHRPLRTPPGVRTVATAGHESVPRAKASGRSPSRRLSAVSTCPYRARQQAVQCQTNFGSQLSAASVPRAPASGGMLHSRTPLAARCSGSNRTPPAACTAEYHDRVSVERGTQHHWPAAGAGKRTPFVGREEERATLRQLLDEAAGGCGTVAMIGGEPGAGKTRLAEEVAVEARDRGFLTVTGHCYDAEGGIPYQPFVEALEQCARVVPAVSLRLWLGEDGAEVARLAPELRRLFPDLPVAGSMPPEEGRRLLYHAWSAFIERAAHVQPVIFILEDVHWADESSLLLLQHLARHLSETPALVLCTYRDAELDVSRSLARTLEELVRQRLALDLVLGRLSEQGVAEMVAAHGHGAPPPPLVALIYKETEGNPFFVEEVLRHLAEQDKLLAPGGGWVSNVAISELEVPRSVRLVIQQRLARLGDGCQRLLASAAVAGREFSFEVVEALGDLEPGPLIDAIEEAARAGLIHDVSSGAEARYSFAHELVRQTLLGGLSMPRRQRLHLRVAETMERIYGSSLDSHVAELAFHYRQAGAGAAAGKAVDYSIRAGGTAAAVFAWREAISHYEGALEASENANALDTQQRCAVLLALGAALLWAGDFQRLYGAIAPQAYELAMTLGAQVMAAQAAWLAGQGLYVQFAGLAPARPDYGEWAERLDRLAVDGTVHRINADLALARTAAVHFRVDEAAERCLRALVHAREQEADWDVVLSIFTTFALWCRGPRFDARRRQFAADIASSLVTVPRDVSMVSAEYALALIAGEELKWGCRAEASHIVDRMAQFEAQRPPEVGPRIAPHFRDGLFAYMDGELERAARTAAEVFGRMVSGEVPLSFVAFAGNFGFRPRYYLGRPRADFGRLDSEERSAQPPRAVLLGAFGRNDEARSVLLRRRQAAPAGAAGAPDAWSMFELVMFVEAATLIGDAELAAWFAAPLWESGAVTTGDVYTTMVNRHLGAAAALLGETGRALEYYTRALAEATAMQFRPEVALTHLALAELLAEHYGRTDEALEHLRTAIPEFQAMSMSPSLDRAQSLQNRLVSTARPRSTYPDGLTQREVEVLRLVAAGRTNQQIAGQLVISQNTVLRHVSHIFDKTGASNRVEAAAYAHRHGIEPPLAD
ncbi:MAG: hypothetical protein C0506_14630 [Anaerolinea sp.]|nr:hypothetical protein [Anaerolinea sp.]